MRCFIGIDLGSTTSKAVLVDENLEVLGRGITNSRSNYETATRFTLLRRALHHAAAGAGKVDEFLDALELAFRLEQFVDQLDDLRRTCLHNADGGRFKEHVAEVSTAIADIFRRFSGEAPELFKPGARRRSDFFRDLAGSRYMALAEDMARESGLPYDALVNVYDRSIIEVENRPPDDDVGGRFTRALARLTADGTGMDFDSSGLEAPIREALEAELEEAYVVGTGYGRATLPFSKEHIRSEILCHGLGAHIMYPATRTVLDIGGQDTKAIQIDADGIVENFQMNDRCAAGCGRYLGYIADEMKIGVHELGPIAIKSSRAVRINSTCTVFAGAELRDRLAMGEKREDVLAGLHRAIILRAMSIIARSGGITDQFTWTGGVAKNEAAVRELRKLVQENYGDVTININPDSIYTGALGAAAFARRAVDGGSRETGAEEVAA